MSHERPVIIAAPYDEGAIMALARFFGSAHTGHAQILVRAKPWDAPMRAVSALADRSGSPRRTDRGSATDGVTGIAPVSEFVRAVTFAATRSGMARRNAMDHAARRFDAAASRRMHEPAVVIGMPVACARTFTANASLGGTNVYHAVNSHPRFQNAILRDAYPSRLLARELIPDAALRTVDEELSTTDILLSPSATTTHSYAAEQIGHRPRATVEVPYAVDLDVFGPDPAPDAARLSGRGIKLVFVGQISYRKGLPVLRQAMARLAGHFSLDLYGPIVAPELLDGLPVNMRYRGMIGHGRLPRVLNDADAFVLPSLEDAFGLVVSEAAATGLPVITTSATGAAAYLPAQDHHVLAPLDDDALRHAIAEVMPLSAERRHELAASFRRCAAGFGWPDYAAQVWQRIDSVTNPGETR